MNPARVKIDASNAGEKEKTGLGSDECNCVRIYVYPVLAKESKKVKTANQVVEQGSGIHEDVQDLILEILRIPGVSFLWVYPRAIQIHKDVVADWKTMEGDGVFDQACEVLKKDFEIRFPGNDFLYTFIKGCEFSDGV